jgi:hypothetical protein
MNTNRIKLFYHIDSCCQIFCNKKATHPSHVKAEPPRIGDQINNLRPKLSNKYFNYVQLHVNPTHGIDRAHRKGCPWSLSVVNPKESWGLYGYPMPAKSRKSYTITTSNHHRKKPIISLPMYPILRIAELELLSNA